MSLTVIHLVHETKTPLQIAATKMRDHWYSCNLEWGGGRGYIHCSPGYSHPLCKEGTQLEKEYLKELKLRI